MASDSVRSMNPGFLHLQKLGLELKCPLCLDLLKKPQSVPCCDTIFCRSCLPESTQLVLSCPNCESTYAAKDIRHVPLVENVVTIYKRLNSVFSASARQSVSVASGQDSPKKLYCKEESAKASFSARQCTTIVNKLASTPSGKVGDESGVAENCSLPRCLKYKNQESSVLSVEDGVCNGNTNFQSPLVNLQARTQLLEGFDGVNQVDQMSLGSPSFGDLKDSENDSNYHCGDDTPQNRNVTLAKQNLDGRRELGEHGSSDSGTREEHLRNSKRQKLNYSSVDSTINNDGHFEPLVSQTENLGSAGVLHPTVANLFAPSKHVCGFCQSARISEDTGQMLHYVKGKQVEGLEAEVSNAVHVHRICLDWAPQVYFIDDSIKNLTEELTRGAKLKCTGCGQKGAALGCYFKACRRSYHVPCAMELPKCRWDLKNFLLLCPSHSSQKFPCEKSKRVKQKRNDDHKPLDDPDLGQRDSKQLNLWKDSSNCSKKWLWCGSALSTEEKIILVEFGNMIDVPVTKFWRPDVTHVIASTNAEGACTRTLKVLMAILNGKWVLTMDWIKACIDAKCPVGEEPYEVSLDNHGSANGPRSGRLCALNNTPKLFHQFNFYLSGDFVSGYKQDLQILIAAAGGTIFGSKEEVLEKKTTQGDGSGWTTLVVYNLDPPPGCKLDEEVSILWKRLSEAQDVAAKIGSQVIGHTWVLESIAAYELQPLVR